MHIPQGFFTSQKIVSKYHGTWSVSPIFVVTTNYLWEWKHRKLGWIGLAKIPKVWLGEKARLNIFILHYVDQAYTIENVSTKETPKYTAHIQPSNTSIIITNKSGDSGSPCHQPYKLLKNPKGLPFTKIENIAVEIPKK